MDWKEFLKPNKKKILATLIILVIIALVPTTLIVFLSQGSLLEAPKNLQHTFDFLPTFLVMPFWFPVLQFGLYQCGSCAYLPNTEYDIGKNGEKICTMCSCYSKQCINWPYILINVLFWVVVVYLISCFLFRGDIPKKQVKKKR